MGGRVRRDEAAASLPLTRRAVREAERDRVRAGGVPVVRVRSTRTPATRTAGAVNGADTVGLPGDPVEVAVVLGTRSEAVALAPVVRAMRRSNRFDPLVISTGEQRSILDQVLRALGVRPDVDLTLPGTEPAGSPRSLPPEAVERLGDLLVACRPVAVLVHGDSASAFGAALAAFSEGFLVGHLGAGFRSPEARSAAEMANQRLIDPLARWHLTSTPVAAANLVAEGIDPSTVVVTGSTGLDTLRWAMSLNRGGSAFGESALRDFALGAPAAHGPGRGGPGRGRVLACLRTADRNCDRLSRMADALRRCAEEGADVVLPRHPDGAPDGLCRRLGESGVRVIPPLEYLDYVATVRSATVVVTDSSTVEEEVAYLGTPLIAVGDDLPSLDGALLEALDRVMTPSGDEVRPDFDDEPEAARRVLDALRRSSGRVEVSPSPGAADVVRLTAVGDITPATV
ncbi:MAG: hypothetical protein QG622_1603 [Actinomycetota bacterium]|nr:hypothetical protein [Actinomycetota bacterium]